MALHDDFSRPFHHRKVSWARETRIDHPTWGSSGLAQEAGPASDLCRYTRVPKILSSVYSEAYKSCQRDELEEASNMADLSFEKEIASHLHKLNPEQQQRVLAYIRTLSEERPAGIPGRELVGFVGAIDPNDLREMEKAIEEGCEQVNLNES
jgi:hypothetical protein